LKSGFLADTTKPRAAPRCSRFRAVSITTSGVGQVKKLPYMKARHHRWWRWHTAYGGGNIMDWIGHHNDIAHWGMGVENSGPVRVESKGWTWAAAEVYDTPVEYEGVLRVCRWSARIDLHNMPKRSQMDWRKRMDLGGSRQDRSLRPGVARRRF
jgi:predicted dehydrogenase